MYTHGLLIGKFYPFHKGHADLVRFAMMQCSTLDIVVCPTPNANFSTQQRMMWLEGYIDTVAGSIRAREHGVQIHTVEEGLPDLPEDDQLFWQKWQQALTPFKGQSDDRLMIFAGEDYGAELARHLGGTFIPYPRELRELSGTWCRSTYTAWEQFPLITKQATFAAYAFFGPESTGKTSISKAVQQALGSWMSTLYPEYARGFLDLHGVDITEQKLIDIYHGQSAMQDAAFLDPRSPVLLFDTDLLTTVGWITRFGYTHKLPQNVQAEIAEDLHAEVWKTINYFLMSDEDVPFVPDAQRYGGDQRQTSTAYWQQLLETTGRKYVVLDGSFEQRVAKAVQVIKETAFPWLTNRERSYK